MFLFLQRHFYTQTSKQQWHYPIHNISLKSRVPLFSLLVEKQTNLNCQLVRHFASKIPKKELKGKKSSKVKVLLTDEEMNDVIDVEAFQAELTTLVEELKMDYIKHLSLRTSMGSIDTLPVRLNKQEFPLNQIAQVTRKSPQLVIVNLAAMPQAVPAVIESIQNSGMNLNPQQEGNTIYLPVPKITRDYRETLAKNARMLFMKTKENIQQVQNKYIKLAKQQIDLSEDLIFNAQQQIKAVAAENIAKAEKLMQIKQTELLKQ